MCTLWGEPVSITTPIAPGLLRLARRLRELREQQWPEVRLTQAALARALGDGEPLAPATVSSWESQVAPKLPPPGRLRAYARFFATRRSLDDGVPCLVPVDNLTDAEAQAWKLLEEELLQLREKAGALAPAADAPVRSTWHFADSGPINIVCAQLAAKAPHPADPQAPDVNELHSFADLDALVELHGHLRAENPATSVYFKASTRVVPDDLSGHVALLGRFTLNGIAEALCELTALPVQQVRDPGADTGDIFIVAGEPERRFLPKWRDGAHDCLSEDVGLLARIANPLNSSRTLTVCSGIYSSGVLGAVRSLTDARLRHSNEAYLDQRFKDRGAFALLLRVPVIESHAMTPDFNSPECVLYSWPE